MEWSQKVDPGCDSLADQLEDGIPGDAGVPGKGNEARGDLIRSSTLLTTTELPSMGIQG